MLRCAPDEASPGRGLPPRRLARCTRRRRGAAGAHRRDRRRPEEPPPRPARALLAGGGPPGASGAGGGGTTGAAGARARGPLAGPPRRLRIPLVPPRPARARRRGPLRSRRPRRAPDGIGEVAHLPAAGADAGRGHPGRLAAHRAHEGPGRGHGAGGAARHLPQLGARRRGAAQPRGRGSPGGVRARLRGARGARGRRRRRARRRAPRARGRGRGPLHQPLGARLPARLPQPGRAAGPVRRRPGAGAHRHGHAEGGDRHRRAAGHAHAGPLPRLGLPPQPPAAGGEEGRGRPGIARRDPRPCPRPARGERHRLLHRPEVGRVGGRVPPFTKSEGHGLPRRPGGRGAGAGAGRLPGWAGRRGGGHRGLRDGHRQARHPLRDPPRHARIGRGVLPGDRARRPRRGALRLRAPLLVGRRDGP